MLATDTLSSSADQLEKRLRQASSAQRLKLQPEFGRLLQDIEKSGSRIPSRLQRLHEQLLDEVIEARFDNLPI